MREKLIELLDNSFDKQYNKRCLLTAPHTADDLIANGVTVQEWISVKDGLPLDYKERVLVKINNFNDIIGHPSVDTDRYVCGGGWVRWGGHVTHWMPLPEPPKGE